MSASEEFDYIMMFTDGFTTFNFKLNLSNFIEILKKYYANINFIKKVFTDDQIKDAFKTMNLNNKFTRKFKR